MADIYIYKPTTVERGIMKSEKRPNILVEDPPRERRVHTPVMNIFSTSRSMWMPIEYLQALAVNPEVFVDP
jgi:hypothetical protein